MNEAAQEVNPKPHKSKRVTFIPIRRDYYTFGFEFVYDPHYWIRWSVKFGTRVWTWEYDLLYKLKEQEP